jgi:hypothetical protein
MKIKEKNNMENYKILAEYYNKEKLIYYIVETEDGKVVTVKEENL